MWIETPGERTSTSMSASSAGASGPATNGHPARRGSAPAASRSRSGPVADDGDETGVREPLLRGGARTNASPCRRPRRRSCDQRVPRSSRAAPISSSGTSWSSLSANSGRDRTSAPLKRGSDLACQPAHDGVIAPARIVGRSSPSRMRSPRSSPTHSNGLWAPAAVRRANPSNCASSASRSRAEDRGQCARLHERGEDQEHEPAFVAVAAPRAGAGGGIQAKDAVAAGEHRVIGIHRERTPARSRARRPGAGSRRSRGRRGSRRRRRREQPLHPAALAELMVDLDPLPDRVRGSRPSARLRARPHPDR